MYFNGLRIIVDGIGRDVPLGTFADGQLMQYDAAANQLRGGPKFAGTYGPDDVPMFAAGALVPRQVSVRRLSGAAQVVNATSYTDVQNLAIPINRAGLYTFDYLLLYQTSAVTEGIGIQLAYSGSFGSTEYVIDMFTDPNTRAPLISAATFSSGVPPQTAGPGPVTVAAYIRGGFSANGLGTLALQMRAETGGANNVTARTSSWARVFSAT